MKKITLLVSVLLLLIGNICQAGNKSRIFTGANLLPMYGPNGTFNPTTAESPTNPRWVQNQKSFTTMSSLGFDHYQMIYNGSLNSLDMWYGHSAAEMANGQILWNDPITGLSNNHNYCNPVDPIAVQKIANLHKTNPYGGSDKLLMPICFDIENAPTMEINIGDSADVQLIKVKRICDAINAARSYAGGGPSTDVWWYGFPGFPNPADTNDPTAIDRCYDNQKPIADLVTSACCSFYNWDVPVVNPASWYAMPKMMDAVIAKHYPHLAKSKIAFINPFKQMYWPQNAPAAFKNENGKPVDYKLFCAQVDYLVENDWDIVVWVDGVDCSAVYQHFSYVAGKRRY